MRNRFRSPLFITIYTLLIITLIQYLFVYIYLRYLKVPVGRAENFTAIVLIFLINLLALFIIQAYRSKREKEKLKLILQSEKDKVEEIAYFTELDKFKSNLISMNQTMKICISVSDFFINVFDNEVSKVYLWNEEVGSFVAHPEENRETRFFVFDPFLLWISDYDKILTSQYLSANPKFTKIKSESERFFRLANANTIMPLILNQSLIGFILCKRKNESIEISELELSRLFEIKSTVLLSLSNAIFYARAIALTENLENKVKERTKALEEAQTQLILSEKMASLGVMVAGIAHEVNTPAGVINGSADNMGSSLNFLLEELPMAKTIFENEETNLVFKKIIRSILSESLRSNIDPKEKFKLKKGIRERFLQNKIDTNLTDDVAVFLVENNLLEHEEDILFLINIAGQGVLDLLKHANSLDRNLKNIKFGIKNIVRIVRALKYYSHLDQASFADANLIEGIENILIILNNQLKHGIEIERDFQPISLVPCNLDELNQVWTNIIQNASQALKGKGKIKISTFEEPPFVVLEIADNGSGIPAEIIDRIWDPFFTTKDQGEGTGLGLGIVKGIIDKHKGKISVRSKPGETVFKIMLPAIKT